MKYRVRFYMDYEIEADNEDEALEAAREELEAWAMEEAHRGISNMLDVEIKQMK